HDRCFGFRLRLGEELADVPGELGGLVLADERIAVVDLDQPALGEDVGKSPPVLAWHEAVFGGPDHEHGASEGGELLGRGKAGSAGLPGIARILGEVAAYLLSRERLKPVAHQLVGNAAL